MEGKLIYSKIIEVMEEMGPIDKGTKNVQQGFMYRSVDAFMNAANAAFCKVGIFLTPEVLSSTRDERLTKSGGNMFYTVQRIKYTFYATDGSSVSATVDGEAMDSGDKGSNKCLAIGLKYALAQTFMIAFKDMKDDDPDGHIPDQSKKLIPQAPAAAKPKAPLPLATKKADQVYTEQIMESIGLGTINATSLSIGASIYKSLQEVNELPIAKLKVLAAILKENGLFTPEILASAKLAAYGK